MGLGVQGFSSPYGNIHFPCSFGNNEVFHPLDPNLSMCTKCWIALSVYHCHTYRSKIVELWHSQPSNHLLWEWMVWWLPWNWEILQLNAPWLAQYLNPCTILWEVELLENLLRATSYSNIQMKHQCCHVYAQPSRKNQRPSWKSLWLRATTNNRIHIDICCPLDNYQVAYAKLMAIVYQKWVVEGIF